MNSYSISSIVAAVVCLSLAGFVYTRKKRDPIKKSFSLATGLIGIWSLFPFICSLPLGNEKVLFLTRLIYIAAIFVPSFYLKFTLHILKLSQDKTANIILKASYLIAVFFVLFSFQPVFIKGVSRFRPDFAVIPGLLYAVFVVYFGFIYFYPALRLFAKYKRSTGFFRIQLKYLGFAFLVAFISGVEHFLSAFGVIEILPHDILVTIFSVIMAYAILRYRLMDITVAVTRTGIFVAVYTLVLGLPFALAIWAREELREYFGVNWWALPLGLMAALATAGPFIYIYAERKAEEALLKEQRRYQEILKQAAVGMTRIRNLKRLLSLITHIVTKTVRISYAAIYLYNKDTDEFVLQVNRDKGRVFLPRLEAQSPLISRLSADREPLIYEEVRRQIEDSGEKAFIHLGKTMELLGASVIIPSFLDDRFMGFIVLGDKVSGQIYTSEDLNVFRVLASQAALAIENAQFYEETKEMQQQIAQAEKMATVGTMADGLSHQINNRFYALSLIAGDTLDTLKITDTTKCSPEIKEMLKEINHALERIQVNVMQGGEVVKGILKYTRKGEEKFEAIPLDQILDGTLEMVQYKVKLDEIDIIRDYPKDIPAIKGNMVQLQEVFFNLIDNGYDATVERKETLKEPNYRGKIIVSARAKDSKLEIIIEDNGIGVKDADYKKLFTPFFTTKSTSRKGTGLGLYVIQRVITDTHKGAITFESQYKAGTKFIIQLPAAK